MKTKHGAGLVLYRVALAITGTLGTCRPVLSILLGTIRVLCLYAGSLQASLVYAILSILQALALA